MDFRIFPTLPSNWYILMGKIFNLFNKLSRLVEHEVMGMERGEKKYNNISIERKISDN